MAYPVDIPLLLDTSANLSGTPWRHLQPKMVTGPLIPFLQTDEGPREGILWIS